MSPKSSVLQITTLSFTSSTSYLRRCKPRSLPLLVMNPPKSLLFARYSHCSLNHQDYKAPSYIDPKLLNPEYAFKQVLQTTTEVNPFNQKSNRKRFREVGFTALDKL